MWWRGRGGMRLTDIQRDVVARHLRSMLGDKAYGVLEGLFGEDAGQYIRIQPTPHAYALETLRVCEERWREGDRQWCFSLWSCSLATIQEVADVFQIHRALLEQEDKLRQEQTAFDPFSDMRVCPRRYPFLDRRRLRESLKKLAADNGPTILVVDGPARSGRSYTRRLIEHIAEHRGPFQVAWNVCSGPGATLEARNLANSFSMDMKRPPGPIPEKESQAARWAQQLAQWVLNHDADAGSRWWLVFDQFDGEPLEPAAQSFIESLAERIATGPARKRFRLVLLQYPHPLPPSLRRDVIQEKLQAPDELGVSDVSEYFEWLFTRRKEAFEQQAIQELVQEVMQQVPSTGDRLQQLCDAVDDVTYRLLGET